MANDGRGGVGHGFEAGTDAIRVVVNRAGACAGVWLGPAVMAMSAAELAMRVVELNTLAYMRFQRDQQSAGTGFVGQWVASQAQVAAFAALVECDGSPL